MLLVAGGAVTALARLEHTRAIVTAGLRATVQLAAVATVIGWALNSRPLLFAFLAVMFAVATRTASRRIISNHTWRWAAVPIGAAVFPVIVLLVTMGLLPVQGIALIPITGILIGGALTATVLAGRRALEELETRHGEVEAALSPGLPDRDARLEIARPSAAGALIPALDQTRTVGLVTLPGAFIGMLLGGASPLLAGAVQLFVLVALLAVEAVAVAVVVAVVLELVARGKISRPPRTYDVGRQQFRPDCLFVLKRDGSTLRRRGQGRHDYTRRAGWEVPRLPGPPPVVHPCRGSTRRATEIAAWLSRYRCWAASRSELRPARGPVSQPRRRRSAPRSLR